MTGDERPAGSPGPAAEMSDAAPAAVEGRRPGGSASGDVPPDSPSAAGGPAGAATTSVVAESEPTSPESETDRIPPRAKWFVGALLVLLAVPGIIGFELWPMTGWRLFSLSRDDSQTMWVVQAVAEDGSSRPVSLEELPLRYRHAAWPMAELPGASEGRRQAVCEALLGAVVEVEPGTAAVEITSDRQQLVESGGEWTLTHDPEVLHTCTVPGTEPEGGR